MFNELNQAMDLGKFNDYQKVAQMLLEQYEAVDVLAAALEMLGGDSNREHEVQKIKLTAERPIIVKRPKAKGGDNSRYRGSKGSKKDYHGEKKDYKKDSKKDYRRDNKGSKKESAKDTEKKKHKKSTKSGYFLGE